VASGNGVREPARPPSQLDQLADRFVEDYAAAHPDVATAIGVRGHDDRWPDLSPEGHAGHADPYANRGFQQIRRLVGVPPVVLERSGGHRLPLLTLTASPRSRALAR
jgi:hypothetical protein